MAAVNDALAIERVMSPDDIIKLRATFPTLLEALRIQQTVINQVITRVGGSGSGGAVINLDDLTSFASFNRFDTPQEPQFHYQTFFQLGDEKELNGIKSTLNSSSTPLAGGATFTGTAETNDFTHVMVSLKTDVAGTLYIDFSNDVGTNWDSTLTFSVSAGSHEFQPALKGPRTIRVRYINGAGAQSYFRMGTYYLNNGLPVNSPLNTTIQLDSSAQTVRSIPTDIELAFGRFEGHSEETRFGHVMALDAADNPCDIWAFANDTLAVRSDTKTFPTVASVFYMASDSAADTSIAVTIDYIDSTGAAATTTVSTNAANGQTPVSLVASMLDVNRIYLSGSNQANAGNIYVVTGNAFTAGAPTTPSQCVAMIEIGQGQSHQCHYTVPSGYRMRIKWLTCYVGRGSGLAGSATIHIRAKTAGGSWRVRRDFYVTTSLAIDKPVAGLVFDAGDQIALRVEDVTDGDTNVSAEFQYDLVAV